jgi:pimeloyl-ACP methyl ester carboxylesterase
MGGMIAQSFAIRHRPVTRSLVSIMSTTGDLDVGQPHPEALSALMVTPATTRDEIIEQGVETTRVISSPVHFDAERARRKVEAAYDRANYPDGRVRQLLAIITAASRTEGLRGLDVPAVVIHGELDPLVDPSGGVRTHEALQTSELVLLPDAGHDLPEIYWPNLVEKITALAAAADAAAAAHAPTSR